MQTKDNNARSGRGRITCPFYEELDSVLCKRACSSPVVLLESSRVEESVNQDSFESLGKTY